MFNCENVAFPSAAKRDAKDETDDRTPQFKKKVKELRILDAKTAQNLCKYLRLHFIKLIFPDTFNTITSHPL